MVQKKIFLSSSCPLGASLYGGFGNSAMMTIKLKWKLYILYRSACFWLQVIENYDSAGFKNEEISNFSCQKIQTGDCRFGYVHDSNILGNTSFPSFCSTPCKCQDSSSGHHMMATIALRSIKYTCTTSRHCLSCVSWSVPHFHLSLSFFPLLGSSCKNLVWNLHCT